MTNDAAREHQDDPGLPPPPIGEAAALVARLLSGSDPHAAVRKEDAASSKAPPEPAPTDSHSIPTVFSGPFASLLADHNGSADSPSPNVRPPRHYPKTTISLMIVVLVVLTFGSGLAVGYGILGRRSKAVGKSTAQEATPSATRDAAPSQTIANEASLSDAAGAASLNSTANLTESRAPLPLQVHGEPSLNTSSAGDLQSPNAQPRNVQTEHSYATNESPLAPLSSSVFGNPSPSTKPAPGQPSAAAAQPVSIPPSRPVISTSPKQTAVTSTSPAHPESAPIDSPHPVDALASANAPAVSGTVELPAADPEARQPVIAALGHIDPCELVHSVQPVYPDEAKRLHVEGDVQLRVVVGTDGTVQSVGLISGPPLLTAAAIDAAREFRYKPALLNGQPIQTVQTIAMSFNLKN